MYNLFSDGTVVQKFGKLSFHPLFMTCANLHEEERVKDRAWRFVGLIPALEGFSLLLFLFFSSSSFFFFFFLFFTSFLFSLALFSSFSSLFPSGTEAERKTEEFKIAKLKIFQDCIALFMDTFEQASLL